MLHRSALLAVFGLLSFASACVSPTGDTKGEQRAYVKSMRDDALAELYKQDPGLRARVASAAGYAAFSNLGVQVLLLSAGQGYGVVHDNQNGKDTYMRMAEVGGGLGAGLKDFRAVYVFRDRGSLETFTERGWEFGSEVDAAARAGDKGGAAGAQASVAAGAPAAGAGAGSATRGDAAGVGSGIEVYQFTENGLALQWNVAGTKYWKDGELN